MEFTADQKFIFDTVLKAQGVSFSTDDMLKEINEAESLKSRIEELEKLAISKPMVLEVHEEASGEIPEGELTWKKAYEVFPSLPKSYDFEVPYWEWDGVHPAVPKIDPDYILRKDYLLAVLYGIFSNSKTWLQGHTGSGKTTLVEQVAAHLNYPLVRINFDSEISRYDLVGKLDLRASGGATETVWVDGILPQAMAGPFIICFDEIDFVRPDIAYVMQSVLENSNLRLLEDGGREIKPHVMCRMFATGNTNGQGDEHGIYQGARPQSAAFLNRFTNWINVEYLNQKQITKLIQDKVPAYGNAESLAKYVEGHQSMFEKAEVTQPISARTFLEFAKKASFYKSIGVKNYDNAAFKDTIGSACNADDSKALAGLFARHF